MVSLLLQTLQFNEGNKMAKTEKLNFSKFFPDTTNFIVVSGEAKSPTDFDLSVKIGDGTDQACFYLSDWMNSGDLSALKAIQEGINKAIEFHAKALKLPKIEAKFPWDAPVKTAKPAKATASKKATTKK